MEAKNAKPARKAGAITYSFATPHHRKGEVLYVNAVEKYRCVNSCGFCSREDAIKGKPNIYEKKAGSNLYLPKAPLAEDIVQEVAIRREKDSPSELIFVGLGEPLLNHELVRDSIQGIKESGFEGKIALDTNGLVKCWYFSGKGPAGELKEAGLDEIRISVNAVNEKEYQALCNPPYKNAFELVCSFVKDCLKANLDVFASFVVGFEGEVETRSGKEYAEFAVFLGVNPENVLLRQYVEPLE